MIGSGISCVVGNYFGSGSHIGYNCMNFRRGNARDLPGLTRLPHVTGHHYKDENPTR